MNYIDLRVFKVLRAADDITTHPGWKRFQEYTRRVRKITLEALIDYAVPRMSVWPQVLQSTHGEPILPHLRHACLSSSNSLIQPPLTVISEELSLLTQSVSQLDVDIGDTSGIDIADDVYGRLFTSIIARSPNIECLTMSCSARWLPGTAYDFPFQRLRSLRINRPDIDITALLPLAHAPCLETLSFSIVNWDFPEDVELILSHLRTLTISGPWDKVQAFITRTQLPNLHTLSTHTLQYDPTDIIPDATSTLLAITTHLPHLVALHITCHPRGWALRHLGSPDPVPIPGGTLATFLEPLLTLRDLHTFSFRFSGYRFSYSSQDLFNIADAWPGIQDLRLAFHASSVPDEGDDGDSETGEDDSANSGGRPGFEALAYLAHGCSDLRALHLPVMELRAGALEGAEVEGALADAGPGGGHQALRELEMERVVFVGGDPDALSAEMTRFVRRVFPRVYPRVYEEEAAVPPVVVLDEDTGGWSRLV